MCSISHCLSSNFSVKLYLRVRHSQLIVIELSWQLSIIKNERVLNGEVHSKRSLYTTVVSYISPDG